MERININVGPLTSFNSVVYHVGRKLSRIRELYFSGLTPDIQFDFTSLEFGNINISALAAILSAAKKLRDFLGYSIPATIKWDPQVQGFLGDVDFFKIADKFRIFNWIPDGIIGGYKVGIVNPNTKILYFGDITPVKNLNSGEIGTQKAILKQKIAPNFLMRSSKIFKSFDDQLEDIITNTTLELIVNSLMHAEEIAFVGLQRTTKRITISVCDSGIGFPKSLARTYKSIEHFKSLSHIEGIFIGSLIQRNIHGLRLAINEVLNFDDFNLNNKINDGWVIISSFDSELRWQKNNWAHAINYFDSLDLSRNKPDVSQALGTPVLEYIDKEKVYNGYWKPYDSLLVGTRITFEIKI